MTQTICMNIIINLQTHLLCQRNTKFNLQLFAFQPEEQVKQNQ